MARTDLLPGKEKRVFTCHPWIFRSDIGRVEGEFLPGDVVDIVSSKGRFLARGYYNPNSQIALRIMTYREDESVDRALIFRRIHEAVEYRRAFADLKSCRLVFAESDRLPALIVDAFGDVLVLQCLALGMERFKQDIVDALVDELHPRGIWERNDVPVRKLEGLEMTTGLLYGEVPDRVLMTENGVKFWVDVKEGQKTGFFLDQKENRAAIAPFVKDRTVLDCFTHTGSFALHAGKYGAKEVTGVDISEYACLFAAENAKLNGLQDRVRFVTANAFDLLSEQSRQGTRYDTIILDPPAFTKTRSAVESAIRGYKEINLRAMKMIAPGGYLITCSCSQHVLPEMFKEMVLDAAKDAKVLLRLVEFRTQGKDHPILPYARETQYLKCGIYQVFPMNG
jgi:23S rRNA (cytosine1962-C5)-methyltransferase